MHRYNPLTIPKDTAWDRRSLFYRLHHKIRSFVYGVRNIVRWIPTIWKDRDWDHNYILEILKKKLEHQRECLVYNNRHTGVEQINRYITIVLNLLVLEQQSHYETEYLEYIDEEFDFINVRDTELYEIKCTVLSDNLDEYLNRYRSSVRKVKATYPDLEKADKQKLARYVSRYNQLRCRNLLFEILKHKLNSWWD
jgi:hypothetical protein